MKNSMMMQIYADVTNKDIYLCGSAQTCARGSAILGAAAAGPEVHGCKDIYELIDKLGKLSDVVYHPISENVEKYKKIYALYKQLSHEMAKDGADYREILELFYQDIKIR